MLSIQQLIKALRKLQNGNSSGGGDLVRKSLKYAAAATNPNSPAATTTTAMPPGMVTSLLAEHDAVTPRPSTPTTIITTAAVTSPKQQQQPQTSNSSQQSMATTASSAVSSIVDCGEIGRQQHTATPSPNISLISYLHEYGSAAATLTADSTTTSDTAATTDQTTGTVNVPSCLRRSEQIQNFYQQQLHHFHTQHNQSLCAKQKQTQFAMSSLAAEPLALKQDEYVAGAPAATTAKATTTNDSSGNCYGTVEDADAQQNSSSNSSASSKPCFNTGLAEILQFMELIGNLKHTKRTGWVLRDVDNCESISGHMYRMSMMTFLLDGTEGLNQIRCMELALVHDLAESLVGDITPFCGVSKCDKRAMEFKAMADICKLIEPRGKRIMELFEEYEDGQSAESKFVKDLDRLDMVMQAFEYEKRDDCLLKHQEFFDSTEGKFKHPFVKKLVDEIYEQRRSLAKAKGATPPPKIEVPNMEEYASNGHSGRQEQQQESSSSASS